MKQTRTMGFEKKISWKGMIKYKVVSVMERLGMSQKFFSLSTSRTTRANLPCPPQIKLVPSCFRVISAALGDRAVELQALQMDNAVGSKEEWRVHKRETHWC